MRQSKQARIDELERTLMIEQEGLRAEKANLNRLVEIHKSQLSTISSELTNYKYKAWMVDQLLEITKNLSIRKP